LLHKVALFVFLHNNTFKVHQIKTPFKTIHTHT
jgi:hypothetical protein